LEGASLLLFSFSCLIFQASTLIALVTELQQLDAIFAGAFHQNARIKSLDTRYP
jgi:hypothetical protein